MLREMEAPDLAQADIDRAMAEGDMAREAYYRRRIEISGCPLPVLRALHERLARDTTIGERDARATVRHALREGAEDDRQDWRERFETLDDGFDVMLRAGVLGKDADGRYYSPIPSLTRYTPQLKGRHAGAYGWYAPACQAAPGQTDKDAFAELTRQDGDGLCGDGPLAA